MRFCPICGDVLYLVQHTSKAGVIYWLWECPEQDWFEPADPPGDGQSFTVVVDDK